MDRREILKALGLSPLLVRPASGALVPEETSPRPPRRGVQVSDDLRALALEAVIPDEPTLYVRELEESAWWEIVASSHVARFSTAEERAKVEELWTAGEILASLPCSSCRRVADPGGLVRADLRFDGQVDRTGSARVALLGPRGVPDAPVSLHPVVDRRREHELTPGSIFLESGRALHVGWPMAATLSLALF